ncbi:acetyl-CoA carboxylase biotin carboxyl carrier protein [Candidatus Sumerlaeota bacterium]|nr:acetyl-CoA carboxylase biotin carboxyl carrier protein [Candidatus Sumerlaeota bacterium]
MEDIRNLIGIINKNKIKEFDLEQGGVKIRIVTAHQEALSPQSPIVNHVPQIVSMMPGNMMPGMMPQMTSPVMASPPTSEVNSEAKAEKAPTQPEKKEEVDKNVTEIKSPMVGTFYRAPSPESPPYVQIGDRVNPDTVLCIVEAMKLMNEIKAETSGAIVDILVENGQPVEYGQPMFKIKKG